jgi:hypothetical protein
VPFSLVLHLLLIHSILQDYSVALSRWLLCLRSARQAYLWRKAFNFYLEKDSRWMTPLITKMLMKGEKQAFMLQTHRLSKTDQYLMSLGQTDNVLQCYRSTRVPRMMGKEHLAKGKFKLPLLCFIQYKNPNVKTVCCVSLTLPHFTYEVSFFFSILGFELSTFTLSHSTSPFLWYFFQDKVLWTISK